MREQFEGREVRTVAVDPERGPLVALAFELYATGRYTVEQLQDELTTRGLRTRPGKHPACPVSTSKLYVMLRDRYYLGYVSYEGEEFQGRHEPLVTPELFERVQAVLDAKSASGERQRVHHHYLKGSLWCGECHDQGRSFRLIVQRTVGRNQQEYFYFFCRGRQEHVCELPYLDMDAVDEAVARYYATLRLTPEFSARVRAKVREAVGDEQQAMKLLRKHWARSWRSSTARRRTCSTWWPTANWRATRPRGDCGRCRRIGNASAPNWSGWTPISLKPPRPSN